VSTRITAGSSFKRFLRFVLIDEDVSAYALRCLAVPPGVRVLQIEDHSYKMIKEKLRESNYQNIFYYM
jgi:hypothetical protein